MKLGLVSCTKSKRTLSCKAYEMYSASNLFRKAYQYTTENYDMVVILSAKYGLLLPDDEIEPYDLTLKTMNRQQCKEWANNAFEQMKKRLDLKQITNAYFHTGKRYRKHLIPKLEIIGIKCTVPLKGLSFGRQLAWYDTKTKSNRSSIVK